MTPIDEAYDRICTAIASEPLDSLGRGLLAILRDMDVAVRAEARAAAWAAGWTAGAGAGIKAAGEVVQTRAALMRSAADEHQEEAAQTAWELRMVAGKLDSVARDIDALPLPPAPVPPSGGGGE